MTSTPEVPSIVSLPDVPRCVGVPGALPLMEICWTSAAVSTVSSSSNSKLEIS